MTRSANRNAAMLRSLLDHLAAGWHEGGEPWPGGAITPIEGGWNNLLYRVTGPSYDWAVKVTVRDERDRAGREYGALLALRRAGLAVAPELVLLDRRRYPQPVVVQTWLEGEASRRLPEGDAEWEPLVRHMATVHSLTPRATSVRLRRGVVDARTAQEARRLVREQMARLPEETHPASLRGLVRRLEAAELPRWARVTPALCRVDNNLLNVIRRPGGWASVDWENAGWGDPAFDVAQLMTHPAYREVPPSRWAWVVETYGAMVGDGAVVPRIETYRRILAVWWVARLARYLYEVPRGLDERLVAPSDGWRADIETKLAHYVRLAEEMMS